MTTLTTGHSIAHASTGRRTGRFIVTGWRERRWNSARFTIERDATAVGGSVATIVENADWPTAWEYLTPTFGIDTESILRSALPVKESS